MPVYKQGSFPPAYGSAQDPRYTDVTQLDYLTTERVDDEEDALLDDVTEGDVDAELAGIRPADQMPGPAPYKQIFQFVYQLLLSGAPQDGNFAIPFKAQSLRVDNHTPSWIFISQLRIYVPPDWYGAIYSCTGMSQFTFIYQAPPGIVNTIPINIFQIVNCVAHSERLIDVAGNKRV